MLQYLQDLIVKIILVAMILGNNYTIYELTTKVEALEKPVTVQTKG